MNDERKIVAVQRKLKTNFLVWFLILIVLAIVCFTTDFGFSRLNDALAVNMQQLLILALLGGIPGVLVWSRNRMKMLVEVSDVCLRLRRYEKYATIRQSVFFILGLLVLFMHVLTSMNGTFMLFLVVICLCMFILPTRGRLEAETHLMEPEPEFKPDSESEIFLDPESDPDSGKDSESFPEP
jgi:hypothetical protein